MKLLKLLFALLFAVSMTTVSAQQNNSMCANNAAGGTIVLTKATNPEAPGSYIAISSTNTGQAMYGSWALIGETTIIINWIPSGVSMFQITDFYMCRL